MKTKFAHSSANYKKILDSFVIRYDVKNPTFHMISSRNFSRLFCVI